MSLIRTSSINDIFCRICCLLCILFGNKNLLAQFRADDFVHYRSSEGLSDNNVYCLAQDDRGYIWIGTESGLNLFDGNSFTFFPPATGPLYLPGFNTTKIVRLNDHRLGVITRRGFHVINSQNFLTENYLIPDTTFFASYLNEVFDAVELSDRTIVLSSNTGIYAFDKPGHLSFRYDYYKPTDVGHTTISYGRTIIPLNDFEVLVYTQDDKVDYYNFSHKFGRHISPSENQWNVFFPQPGFANQCKKIGNDQYIIYNSRIDSIIFFDRSLNKTVISKLPFDTRTELNWTSQVFPFNDSTFAIDGSRNGYYLFHINKKSGVITCNPEKFLPEYKCNCFLMDKEGRLWIGTRTGLLKQKNNYSFLKCDMLNTEPPREDVRAKFTSICRVRDRLYIGALNKYQGLFIVDTSTMKVVKKLTFYGGKNDWSEILSIQNYYMDTLWIGSNNGLIWLDTKTLRYDIVTDDKGKPVFPGGDVTLFPPDKNGFAWLCKYMDGQIARYDIAKRKFTFFSTTTDPALPFSRIKQIVYDAYGDVWVSGHGLARWNNEKQKFDTLITVYAGPNKFGDDILTIAADKNGSLWLHNAENGLLEYRIREKKFYYYSGEQEALSTFPLQSFAEEVNDKLWFTTGTQLGSYDIASGTTLFFDKNDGMPDDRSTSRIIYYDKDRNYFYSLHNDYLVSFSSLSHQWKNIDDTSFVLTGLELNDRTFYFPSLPVHLRYNQQNITIRYAVVDYDMPEGWRFAYRLNHGNWISLGDQRQINFNRIGTGNMQLQVKAISKRGQEITKELLLIISPPVWQRRWFLLLTTFFVGTVIFILYRYRIDQLKKILIVRTKISQDLHDEVGATLSGIAMYSHLTKDQVKAKKTDEVEQSLNVIQRSAGEMVDKLNDIVWLVNPQHDSLKKLIDKLEEYVQQMALAKNMTLKINIPPKIASLKMSMESRRNVYLFCKEAVNNAMKYSGASLFELSIMNLDHTLEFIIKDNGKGFDAGSVKKGNGLESMQKRAEEIGGKFVLQSSPGQGTTITMVCKIT